MAWIGIMERNQEANKKCNHDLVFLTIVEDDHDSEQAVRSITTFLREKHALSGGNPRLHSRHSQYR
jgi:hypothetical protein